MPEQLHHRNSPSKLEQIMLCPGSVRLGEQFQEQGTNAYAEEGTLLHAHMAEALDLWPDPYVPDTENPEHRQLILACLEQVDAIMDITPNWKMLNDQRVSMRGVDCEGTLDLALYNQQVLHIVDFKFGGGIEVQAENNPQLMAYADGAIAEIEKEFPNWQGEIWLHIMQPRLDQYPQSQVFEEDLDIFKKRVAKAIMLSMSKNPPIHPGEKQCKWCRAGGVCKARHKSAQDSAILAMQAMADSQPITSHTMDIPALAKILQTRKAVEAAFASIEQHLLQQLRQGNEVPGYKLTTGRSSRKWKEHVDVFLLEESLGVEGVDLFETKLKSPAQVEKCLDKAGREALREFYDVIEGPLSLASELSKKPAISSSAAHAFSAVADSNELGSAKYVPLD